MATWRYGVALAGILAGLGGAAYLAFDSITEADGSRAQSAPEAFVPDTVVTVAVTPHDSAPAPAVIDSVSAPQPVASMADLVAQARAAPGAIAYAHAGVGSPTGLAIGNGPAIHHLPVSGGATSNSPRRTSEPNFRCGAGGML